MQQQQQQSGRQFDTGRPMGMAKDDYLLAWNNAYFLVFDIIRNNRNAPNNIDLIHAMDYIEKSAMSADEKNEMKVQVCAVTMGNLTSYVDQYRGLAHTLKIGELYNLEKPYAKRQYAFGPPDAGEPIQL